MHYIFSPLGDTAVVIEVDSIISNFSEQKVKSICAWLDDAAPSWIVEYIPAYTTVTVMYNVEKLPGGASPYEQVCEWLDEMLSDVQEAVETIQRIMKIPVLYGGEHGPDLEIVASHNGITPDEVIAIHTSGEYTVHMIGFAPGFPFIGGMSEKIAAPRRATPRLEIPARTVGIAGMQTGVYPIASPGGWQLIGRTPLELFLPHEDPPSLLTAGNRIQFYEITHEEYIEMRGGAK